MQKTHTQPLLKAFPLLPPPPESFSFSSAVTFCPDVSLKSVTGSGGAISTALCLQVEHEGRRRGAVGELGSGGACVVGG